MAILGQRNGMIHCENSIVCQTFIYRAKKTHSLKRYEISGGKACKSEFKYKTIREIKTNIEA
jgi:hypothetical protein